MESRESFCPEHLREKAKESGFFQCPKCGLVWFGRPDYDFCPQADHGKPVHVAVLCRICDEVIPLHLFAYHLVNVKHDFGEN